MFRWKQVSSLILGLMAVMAIGADVDAQNARRNPTAQENAELEALSSQRRANQRKSDQARQSARELAAEIEDLRSRIVDLSRRQNISEQRAAIYRAKVASLNQQEADIMRKLSTERAKQARLLSALMVYTRNPPPSIFVNSRKANDAVLAAIVMRAVTPELRARTQELVKQNNALIKVRRDMAVQTQALSVTDGDIDQQRQEIETLIAQKAALEDQMLAQADRYEAEGIALAAKEKRLRGEIPLRQRIGLEPQTGKVRLSDPLVGEKISLFGQKTDLGNGVLSPSARGITYRARPGTQVVAPAEGEVEFVGPLANYGQIIILNIGQNYRVVITGLGRVYVDKGRTVARNEPLGRMPNRSNQDVSLYLELRHNEDTINPDTAIALGP